MRTRLVEAMVEAILARRGGREPTREEVERFYRADASFFAGLDHMRIEAIRVAADGARSETEARKRAQRAAERLRAGEPLAGLAREAGDPLAIPIPDGLLDASKLREYVGPTVARAAAGLEAGEVGGPIRSGGSWWIVRVAEREPSRPPPLEAIESEVRAEMRRREDDRELRAYLEDLRSRAEIRIGGE